jgi:hypothetical protein
MRRSVGHQDELGECASFREVDMVDGASWCHERCHAIQADAVCPLEQSLGVERGKVDQEQARPSEDRLRYDLHGQRDIGD